MTSEQAKSAQRISLQGMSINLLLFAAKGAAGLMIHSVSLLSDAIHSLTDIISTLVVLIGLKVSNKPADKEHPYGHERIECVIALLLGIMLFGIGGIISWEGICKLRTPNAINNYGMLLSLTAASSAIVSIAAKEWMYRFTIRCAKRVDSPSMAADAWHHRSDAISSVGSLVGVCGIYLGFPIIDVIACFIISAFVFKAAFDICKDACRRMVDTAGDNAVVESIRETVLENPEVLSIDIIKTRLFGSKLYVDIEVTLDGELSFQRSHQIAHSIHDIVISSDMVKDCIVHVNPSV
jgi:cation diffusion facilitator family transporter